MHAIVGLTAALATVVPQQGMLGARLGMSTAQVRAAAGAPDRYGFVNHPIIGRTRVWRYGRTSVTFDGAGPGARVVTFTTTSPRERLRGNVGVGSTHVTVRSRVRGVRCKVEFGLDHCWLGAFRIGRVVTDFRFVRGRDRVASITVGRVID